MTADLTGRPAPLDPPTARIPVHPQLARHGQGSALGTGAPVGAPAATAPGNAPSSPPRRRLLLVAGVLAVIIAAGVTLGLALSSLTGTFTLTGALTLADAGYGGTSCTGYGGYSDIGAGTSVVVSDATGTVVATGSLGSGRISAGDCVFGFSVPDVPERSDFYSVEVSHRGTVVFDREQLDDLGAQLFLGS